jgi:hypothetical protein
MLRATGVPTRCGRPHHASKGTMKDVKVDVRVNVNVDTASVVLLLASASFALFLYKQNKREVLQSTASPGASD